MKKHLIFILAYMLGAWVTASAQGRKDAVVLTAGYSIQSWSDGEQLDGGPIYEEKFNKFDLTVSYEKFLWRNLFVMPQVSLWYSNNPNDRVCESGILGEPSLRPDLPYTENKAWQAGGTLDVMGAWRVHIQQNFSIDFLTGPMLNLCFASRVKRFGLEFKHLFPTATFDWRLGVALNIKSHLRLGVNLDLRPGKHKEVKTGEKYIYFLPSGENRRNAWRFSVGYRF